MSVALDALSVTVTGTGGVNGKFSDGTAFPASTTLTNVITPTAAATIAIFGIVNNVQTPGTWTVTLGGTAMTLLGSIAYGTATNPGSISLFAQVNPGSGAKTLVMTLSNAGADYYVVGATFSGSVTTSVAAATEGFATNNGTTGNASVTTAVSIPATDAAFAMFSNPTAGYTGTPTNGTFIDQDGNVVNNAAASRYTGAGSTITATCTNAASDTWCAAVVGIVAAASGDTLNLAMQRFFM